MAGVQSESATGKSICRKDSQKGCLECAQAATRHTASRGAYYKIRHVPDLPARLRPGTVRAAARESQWRLQAFCVPLDGERTAIGQLTAEE